MTGKPLITLSIVSHGDGDKIIHLLTSLQTHETELERFQVVITDNLGNDLPEFDVGSWKSLHILRNTQQRGFAYNHNRAFEIAKGKYFAVLNPDLIFKYELFDKLLTSLNIHQVDLIAPQIVDANNIIQDATRSLPTPMELIQRRLPNYQFDTDTLKPDSNGLLNPDWIAAMFWLMPSNTYRELNGMDEKFKLYFEDVDFCTRAHLRGLKIVVDTKLQVQHDAQRSSRKKIYYLFLHSQSAFRFFTSSVYHQAKKRVEPKGKVI